MKRPALSANLACTAALLTLALTPAQAQTTVESNVPEAGFGQSQTEQTSPTTTIHVYSRETIIDVLVADDQGKPVRGLTRLDFTVEEDGHAQPIRSFYEYDKTTPPQPLRPLPTNTFTNSTALPANGPVQIFLFDLGSPQDQLVRAKKYIADYFRSMPAGTQVAIFELSPSKELALLQGFTTDGHAAAAAVDNLDVEWIRNPTLYAPIALAGLNQIAAYVAGVKGRKDLIWIVPGMPLRIVHDGGLAWKNPDMSQVHHLMDLYDIFTREQIAIYPLDPRGAHTFGQSPVEQMNALLTQAVADETGGATSNSNDFQTTIANIVNDTLHGYTLSFVPPRPDEDGHYHPIKITVDRPGLHLSYRPGYNDEQPHPPDAVLKQQMTQGPMRLGAIPATQILFYLHVEPASTHAQPATPASTPIPPHTRGVPYSTLFTFDPAQISLTESPDGTRTANIELDLGAFDFYGKLVTARSQIFRLTTTPAQYANFYRKPIQFSLAIDLPPGKFKLRAGVFDTVANKSGTLEIPVTVGKAKK
jgi:VWFA-related protein